MIRVVTVNYLQIDYTLACIESLLQTQQQQIRILVVDNGASEAEHHKLLNALPGGIDVHWCKQNVGYVKAVNIGLEMSIKENSDYALIMNNDTIIDPEAIHNLVECSKRYDDKCIVSGKIYDYTEKNRLQYIGMDLVNPKTLVFEPRIRNEIDHGQYDQEIEFDLIDDVFWLLPREVIESVGNYDPRFWFNAEQADYALRAKKLGFRLIYTPDARIWHKGSQSIGGRVENPILAYWNSQSNIIFRYKHLRKEFFVCYFVSYFFKLNRNILISFVKLVLGRRSNAAVPYAAICGAVSGLKIVCLGIKHRSSKLLKEN